MAELLTVLPAHYEKLAGYLASFPDEKRDAKFWMDRFRLWWEQNPVFDEKVVRGWIVMENREIAGFLGNFPSRFQLFGKNITVYNATTWRVSPNHRNQSLQLLFRQIANAQGTLLFMTTPNETVAKVIRTLNYQKIERTDGGMSFFIGKSTGFLAKSLGGGHWAGILAWIFAGALDLVQNLKFRFSGRTNLYNAGEVLSADQAFDELWDRVKDRCANTYVRSSEFINWYCFGNDDFRKKVFGVYHGKSLVAYMIFTHPSGRKWDFMECLDFFGEVDNRAAIAVLLNCLRIYAQDNSIDLIKLPHFTRENADLLKSLGLFRIKPKDREEYFKVNLNLEQPITAGNSYFTHAVGDVGL